MAVDEAYKAWSKAQTPEAFNTVLKELAPTISSAVSSYASNASPLVYGRAKLLAAQAIRGYDPNAGTKLTSHVMIQLQPLRRFSATAASGTRVSERKHLAHVEMRRTEQEFFDAHGRDPSTDELADLLHVSPKRINQLRLYDIRQMNEGQFVDEEGAANPPGLNAVGPEQAWLDYVYTSQDPVNQKIMEYKLGLYGEKQLSTNEIARRLRITPSAVSQRTDRLARLLEEGRGLG